MLNSHVFRISSQFSSSLMLSKHNQNWIAEVTASICTNIWHINKKKALSRMILLCTIYVCHAFRNKILAQTFWDENTGKDFKVLVTVVEVLVPGCGSIGPRMWMCQIGRVRIILKNLKAHSWLNWQDIAWQKIWIL